MNLIVWCAMMMGQVPVHAEGIVLVEGNSYLTVRFDDGILAVRETSCQYVKPEQGSFIPLTKRK